MTKKIQILLFILCSWIGFSQDRFEKYEDHQEVASMVFSQKMFELFSNIESTDTNTQNFMKIAKKIKHLRVFSANNDNISKQLNADASSYIKEQKLQELAKASKDDAKIKIYVKETSLKDIFSEIFITTNHHNGTNLLILSGEISLEDLKEIDKKMNISSKIGEIF